MPEELIYELRVQVPGGTDPRVVRDRLNEALDHASRDDWVIGALVQSAAPRPWRPSGHGTHG